MKITLVYICAGIVLSISGCGCIKEKNGPANTNNSIILFPFPQLGTIQGIINHGNWTSPGKSNGSFSYLDDTLMCGYNYQRFITASSSTLYTRYDSGKVYLRWTTDCLLNETLKYDFSLSLKDTFSALFMGTTIVDSISTITLQNGQKRKYMKLISTNNPDIEYHWIDGIGDIEGGFLYYHDFEGGHSEFVCHHESSGLIYKNLNSKYNCDSLLQDI